MTFRIVTTYGWRGEPSSGKAKLQIWLKDRTCLTATDGWIDYPTLELVLHPQRLPREITKARQALAHELRASGRRDAQNLRPDGWRYIIRSKVEIGAAGVSILIKYGRWEPSRTVTFASPIVKLIAVP